MLLEAAPPCRAAASAHVTARRALMRFPRPAARPRGWLRLRRLRDAGRARDAPAAAESPGLRDGTVSGRPRLGRGVPGPEVVVPGSCAPRGSGRAREGPSVDPRRGPVCSCSASGVGEDAPARAPASWSWTPSCDRGPQLPQTRFSVAFGDVGTLELTEPR